jgi:hypothetical protein
VQTVLFPRPFVAGTPSPRIGYHDDVLIVSAAGDILQNPAKDLHSPLLLLQLHQSLLVASLLPRHLISIRFRRTAMTQLSRTSVQFKLCLAWICWKRVLGASKNSLSPSPHESDSLTARGNGRMEEASHGAEGLFRC